MENYIVSARKYRPMSFDSVVGQAALTTTLKNAVRSRKLAHAYLFCGPRGVGKTTCARIFAKAINCQNPTAEGEACNECESCRSFNEQRSLSIFELDAASNNSVENIKALMEQTRIPPQVGTYKVFIIDEVHMLSTQAFNAFLKTLEEPPAHVVFILATTEKHKILPTILSRCQIYDFERMTVEGISNHLKMVAEKEHISYEDEAIRVIAEKADGGMRDALSIFDQTASFCQGNITYAKVIEDLNVLDTEHYFNAVDFAFENKVTELMLLLDTVLNKGFDGGLFVNGLAAHLRNVLMAKDEATLSLLETDHQQAERYKAQAAKCTTKFVYAALKILNACDMAYRQSSNKRLLVEITLIQVAQLTQPEDDGVSAGRSPKRLKILFRKLTKGAAQQAVQVAEPIPSTPLASEKKSVVPSTKPSGPTVSSTPVASSRTKVKLGGLGITFSDYKRGPEQPAYLAAEPEVKVKDDEVKTFTQEDVTREWIAMCNRMPKEMVALAMRMKVLEPHISTYPQIEVVVNNTLLLEQLNAIKNRIEATLINALKNNEVKLTYRLAKTQEIKKIKTKRDVFDEMRSSNKAVEKLRELLELEMS